MGVTHKGCIQCCHSTIAVRSSAAHLPSFRGTQESQDSLLLLLLREGPAGILAEVHLQQGVVHHRAAVRDVLRRGRQAKGSWYTQFQLYVSLPQVQMHINDVVGLCHNVHLNGVLLCMCIMCIYAVKGQTTRRRLDSRVSVSHKQFY